MQVLLVFDLYHQRLRQFFKYEPRHVLVLSIYVDVDSNIEYFVTVQPEKCQQTPKEKHCLIEYSVRYRWPHRIR